MSCEIKQKLELFISKYLRIQNVNLDEESYEVPYIFRGFKTMLYVVKTEGSDYEIYIQDLRDRELFCLHLFINSMDCQAILEYIRTEGRKCPIPKERGGTWIMELVDKLMCEIGIEYIKLVDASEIICPIDNQTVDLTMLRLYQGRRSWYENFGYKNLVNPKKYNQTV